MYRYIYTLGGRTDIVRSLEAFAHEAQLKRLALEVGWYLSI